MNTLIALLITLTSYSAQIDVIGNKTYCTFQHSYSGELEQDYAANYEVIFNTPSGPQLVGFVAVVPAGTINPTIHPFRITNGWTIASYELLSWQPYEDEGDGLRRK